MPRRTASRAPEQACFLATKRALRRAGIALDGGCLEASVELHRCLRARGEFARLVRREMPDGGHWTVETRRGEFDPTIGCWKRGRPRDARCGELYAVEPGARPHARWPIDPHANEGIAYEVGRLTRASRRA